MLKSNKIYNVDALDGLKKLDDESINLVVTSPPYNVGIEYDTYDDNINTDDYVNFIEATLLEIKRVLVKGGRLAFVVGNAANKTNREDFKHFGAQLLNLYSKSDINILGLICWDKGVTGGSTAWGSWMSPSAPALRSTWESIVVGKKSGKYKLNGTIDISKEEFLKWTCDLWKISPESAKRVGHPAPFPLEIPHRLIKLYTCLGDVVLDPFCGAGTTCLAAKQLNRKYIGIDISEKYCKMARDRLKNVQMKLI